MRALFKTPSYIVARPSYPRGARRREYPPSPSNRNINSDATRIVESWNREVNSGDRGSDCCPDRRSNNSTHTYIHIYTHIILSGWDETSILNIWPISRGSTKTRIWSKEKNKVFSIRRYLVLTNQSPAVDDHLFALCLLEFFSACN